MNGNPSLRASCEIKLDYDLESNKTLQLCEDPFEDLTFITAVERRTKPLISTEWILDVDGTGSEI